MRKCRHHAGCLREPNTNSQNLQRAAVECVLNSIPGGKVEFTEHRRAGKDGRNPRSPAYNR